MKEAYPVIPGAEAFYYEGSEIGILLCHGFIGTPQSVKYIGEAFAREGYTVSAPRLTGHGTHDQDLANCLFSEWYLTLEKAYLELKERCTTIYVIGQSMGGTLTLNLASHYRDIDGVLLINPAMHIPAIASYQNLSPAEYIQEGTPDIKNPDAAEITYTKVPAHAYHQLFDGMEMVKKRLSFVHCPITCFQSTTDHVVPPENTDYILQAVQSELRSKHVLTNSYHVASMDYDNEKIISESLQFIEQLTASIHLKKVSL
ncbi:monoacylglycerol lipase [Jeotgalibacillus alimentarius]|uniref:Monoacylglycerol lipase n=1 Tax=Jeotgalibacillus alimentarius TaxID=135826 RepID=A0A0C2VRP6_9BACL|nr:alpha/beta fold hydrolase [Jeotgalibacillus alimentarius]KIL51587.1 monoacylglycerol lipase [Jeotgalibacillus alimentarius]